MSKEDNIWFLATLAIGIVLGGVLGLWYTEFSPDQTLIYDYQALIAGALALAAGLMTVFQMARVDIRQAERQRELMSVQLRKDALILDRYRFEVSGMLPKAREFVERLAIYDPQGQIFPDDRVLRRAIQDFSTLMLPDHGQFIESARPLLSAEFESEMKNVRELYEQARSGIMRSVAKEAENSEARQDSFTKGLEAGENMCGRLDKVYEHICELRRKYIKATDLPLKDIDVSHNSLS